MTTVHDPSDNRINLRECASLAAAGYDVQILAPEYAPTSAVPVVPLGKSRSRLGRATFRQARAFMAIHRLDPQVVHIHDPELLPVAVLNRVLGRVVVYDAHEDFAAQLRSKEYLPRVVRPGVAAALGSVERWCARRVSHVMAATPAIARRFHSERTTVVQNFPRLEDLECDEAEDYEERRPTIAYAGGISRIRGLFEMVDAMALLSRSSPARLALAGRWFAESLKEPAAQREGWSSVDDLGWLDRRGVTALLASARAGIVVLHPVPNYLESQPTKLFEYMAAGLPIVASDFPHWKDVIGHHSALFVDPRDPQAISDALRWILDHPAEARELGERGRRLTSEKFHWGSEASKLLAVYRRLLAR